MRKDRNLSSSSVYIRTSGSTGHSWDSFPLGLATLWGQGRRGRVQYLFLFSGEHPVGFGHKHLECRDVVVAQINLGQGQRVRGRSGNRRRNRRQQLPQGIILPCCFGPRARREAPQSVCRRRRIFCSKGTVSPMRGHKPPPDCPCTQVLRPPFSFLHPHIPLVLLLTGPAEFFS